MSKSSVPYWIGKKPSDGKRWSDTDAAVVLDGLEIRTSLFHMYRRYVKQWNDVELDRNRSLSEHAHEICGAKVVGAHRKFVLISEALEKRWILEIAFARGFSAYYPGFSFGLNPFRSLDDIRNACLYWKHGCEKDFYEWVRLEKSENSTKGEWAEYKK